MNATTYERQLLDALTNLATLGVRGDSSNVVRYLGRLLRRPPAESAKWSVTAERLQRIVDDADEHLTATARYRSGPTQTSGQAGIPLDASSNLAVLREEWVPVGPTPVLSTEVSRLISQLIEERYRRDELVAAGVSVTRSVLLTGAPGVGKTMTARYLATELALPLFTIDLAGLMSSYLGRTGQNLRLALDHARRSPSVLFIDEFDALAKRRDDETDVGELKRIVNVLLLELEEWPSHGLLIAATNHPELLDRAIWRRFDRTVTIGLPDAGARVSILSNALARASALCAVPDGTVELSDVVRFAALAFDGWTPADLVRWSEDTLRVAILRSQPISDTVLAKVREVIVASSSGLDGDAKKALARRAVAEFGWSQREIARLLSVSPTAVGKWIAKPARSCAK